MGFPEENQSVTHVAYGLRIAANIAVPGLPAQPGRAEQEAADVQIRLNENSAFPPALFALPPEFLHVSPSNGAQGQPNLRVGMLADGKYFGFFYGDGARFAVERDGREVWADWPDNYTLEDACTYLLGPVIGFVLRLRGVACLHASAVAIGEHAIALVGCPGAGKSTTAAALARSGFPVIADDVVALAEEGENFLVPPGYPRVNLWPDSVHALFGSEEALPRITPTWDKRYVALGDNGLGFAAKPLPLGAVYILGEREEAVFAPVVEEASGGDALVTLVANTYVNYLLDRDMRSREFDVLSHLVARVPIRRVRPPAGLSSVFDLCETIAADARRLIVPSPARAAPRHG
jgi:hypothetical protein